MVDRDTFDRRLGHLEQLLRDEGWASLRNVPVHLYLEVDHDRLYEILHEELDQLESHARAITAALD